MKPVKSLEEVDPHTNYLAKISLYSPPQSQAKYFGKMPPNPYNYLSTNRNHVHPTQFRGPSPHASPNFTTLLQSLISSNPKLHSHFPNKTLLNVVSFLIPKPPLAFFLISKKDVYSKSYLMKKHKAEQRVQKKKQTETNRQKKLITTERTKEQKERITRGESLSPRPIKKKTAKRSKQLVIGFVHILKSSPISLSPNTPH